MTFMKSKYLLDKGDTHNNEKTIKKDRFYELLPVTGNSLRDFSNLISTVNVSLPSSHCSGDQQSWSSVVRGFFFIGSK